MTNSGSPRRHVLDVWKPGRIVLLPPDTANAEGERSNKDR